MSASLMGEVWKLQLSHSQQSVALALADHGDDNGANIYPGIEYIAWKTGYSERQVIRILEELEGICLVEPVGRPAVGKGHRQEYVMHIANVARKPKFERPKHDRLSPNRRHPKHDEMSPLQDPPKGDICDTQKVTFATPKGDISDALNLERIRDARVEPSKKHHIEPLSTRGGGESTPRATPPPRAANAVGKFVKTEQAMFEVTGASGNGRDRHEVALNLEWLEANVTGSDEAVATVLRAAFACWKKPTPPRLSQIRSEWKRMELIAARRVALEVTNGTDSHRNGAAHGAHLTGAGHPNARRESAGERANRKRDDWLADRARRLAALGEIAGAAGDNGSS